MSRQYNSTKSVPTHKIAARLEELSEAMIAAIKGDRWKFDTELTSRIPAECDRDVDLVLGEAAHRLEKMHALLTRAHDYIHNENELLKQCHTVHGKWDTEETTTKEAYDQTAQLIAEIKAACML